MDTPIPAAPEGAEFVNLADYYHRSEYRHFTK